MRVSNLACLVLFLGAACRHLGGGTVAVVGGERTLAESEFGNLDSPAFYGIEGVAQARDRRFDLELGLYHHEEDGVLPATGRTEITGTELAVGIRKTFLPETLPLRPYVGAGLSLFYTDRDNQMPPIVGTQGDDVDGGVYVRVGVDWLIGERFFLGADARWIQESALDYGGYDLDGPAFTLRAGWSF